MTWVPHSISKLFNTPDFGRLWLCPHGLPTKASKEIEATPKEKRLSCSEVQSKSTYSIVPSICHCGCLDHATLEQQLRGRDGSNCEMRKCLNVRRRSKIVSMYSNIFSCLDSGHSNLQISTSCSGVSSMINACCYFSTNINQDQFANISRFTCSIMQLQRRQRFLSLIC